MNFRLSNIKEVRELCHYFVTEKDNINLRQCHYIVHQKWLRLYKIHVVCLNFIMQFLWYNIANKF